MAIAGISVEGLREIQAALNRVPEEATNQLTDVVAKTVFAARQRMEAGAPRETGLLRGAFKATSRATSGRVVVDPSGFYWRFIEHGFTDRGGKQHAARPFVRTAREAEMAELDRRVRLVASKIERDWSAGRFV